MTLPSGRDLLQLLARGFPSAMGSIFVFVTSDDFFLYRHYLLSFDIHTPYVSLNFSISESLIPLSIPRQEVSQLS